MLETLVSKLLFYDCLCSNQLSACMDIHRHKWQEFKWRFFFFLISFAPLHQNRCHSTWFKPRFWWMGLCDKELVLGHLRAFTQSQDKKISFISSRRGRKVSKFDSEACQFTLIIRPLQFIGELEICLFCHSCEERKTMWLKIVFWAVVTIKP